jgi:hypothetical protein
MSNGVGVRNPITLSRPVGLSILTIFSIVKSNNFLATLSFTNSYSQPNLETPRKWHKCVHPLKTWTKIAKRVSNTSQRYFHLGFGHLKYAAIQV